MNVREYTNCRRRIDADSNRRGGMLLEAMIASIAIGAATVLAATVMVSVNANRRTAERLQLATEELNNQLERLTARPWSELTSETVKDIRITSSTAAALPNGELRIHLHKVEKPAPAKRLDAELRWQDRGDMWRPPVRMTAWVFAPREGE
jgi:hypothetical protein